jgi:hypothetical protein
VAETEARLVERLEEVRPLARQLAVVLVRQELVADLVAEGVEATVPPTIRETVEAVARLASGESNDASISVARLALELQLDKSAASRRWRAAGKRGYLRNAETQRGRPARLMLADPLPDGVEVLPPPERLAECCAVASASGHTDLPPPLRGAA